MRRHILPLTVVALIGICLGSIFQPQTYLQALAQQGQQANCQTFPETGQTVCGRFLTYWQTHGGLAQQGYPISGEFQEQSDLNGRTYTVQYFERAVFEYHPENQPPYDVLLSQLGTFWARHKYGSPPQFPGAPTPAPTPTPTPRTLTGHQSSVDSVAISPDGQTLASGSGDSTIKLWRVSDGSVIRTLTGHAGSVRSVAFSPDGQTLASGSGDSTIKLWRVSDGSVIRTLTGHTDAVSGVAFSADGQTLVSGSLDNTIKLWRVSDGSVIRTLTEYSYDDRVLSVAISPDGQIIASGSLQGSMKLWRVSDGSVISTIQPKTGAEFGQVYSVAFSPDGRTGAFGGSGENGDPLSHTRVYPVWLWEAREGSDITGFLGWDKTGHTGPVYSVAYSPDGRMLASGSDDKTIKLWSLSDTSGFAIGILTGHAGSVRSVAYSPDGRTLASGSDDKTIKLWKVK